MMTGPEASTQLSKWFEWISDSTVDPWPNGKPDSSPLEPNAIVIDPTQNFSDVSDEWDDDDEVSSNEVIQK
jgi:hypothetical protein